MPASYLKVITRHSSTDAKRPTLVNIDHIIYVVPHENGRDTTLRLDGVGPLALEHSFDEVLSAMIEARQTLYRQPVYDLTQGVKNATLDTRVRNPHHPDYKPR